MELRRTVLLPYAAEDIFDLIEQAEYYPQFLPWCSSATILERSDEWVSARIEFSYMKVRFGFETRNSKQRPHGLQVHLVRGAFKQMNADWVFTPLGDKGCRVDFRIAYEIAERMLDKLAVPAVNLVSSAMMDAFVKRARATLKEIAPSPTPAPVPVAASAPAAPVPEPPQAPQSAVLAGTETAFEPLAEPVFAPAPSPWAVADPPAGAGAERATLAAPTEPVRPAPPPFVSPTDAMEASTRDDATPLLTALRASRLAPDLTPEQLQVLAGVLRLESHPARAVLQKEGSSGNSLYAIVDGSLTVVKSVGTADETVLSTLVKGDFAHELGFLDGAVRYASLVAHTDARVLVLEREGLESLIERHPMVVYRVMCSIVRTVHRIQSRLAVQAAELTNYIVKQHGRY